MNKNKYDGTRHGAGQRFDQHDTPIWRYMDLPRFVSILATGRLWFAKAATLHDDPYEGFCKAVSREIPLVNDGRGHIEMESGDEKTVLSTEQMIAGFSQSAAEVCENARDYLYVNSWCLSYESMAMWQIYGSLGHGIAVKSSVDRYARAAKFDVPSSHYRLGKVKYHDNLESSSDTRRDFSDGWIPMRAPSLWNEVLKLGFHKRSCYLFENEWRAALYQDQRPEVAGIDEVFDLDQLISAVYVGPRARPFFFDVVSSIMDKFLLQKPLERSVLLTGPRKGTISIGLGKPCEIA
jgi:hypothetical protein